MTPVRPRTQIAWGGIDQGLSSATSLGLAVLAGRLSFANAGRAGALIVFGLLVRDIPLRFWRKEAFATAEQ